jgi:hypothetical protein
MKNILTAIVLIAFATVSKGQVTINSADLTNSGDQFAISTGAAFTGMDPALTGANYTWDYSLLTSSSQTIDTIFDEASTGSLLSLYFIDNSFNPNRSNQCRHGNSFSAGQVNVSDVWDFFYNSSVSYTQPGYGAIVNGAPLPIAFTPKDIIYEFPMTYNSTNVSPSGYTLDLTSTLGIYYSVEKTRTNLVDGWGTITTPYGTFDALRVMSTIVEIDSFYIDSLGVGFATPPITTVQYKWLSPGKGVPVLQINTAGGGIVTGISYLDSMQNTSTSEIPSAISEIVLFPNPVAKELFVKYNVLSKGNLFLEIYSSTGKLITSEQQEKNTTGELMIKKIDLEKYNLKAGNYFLRVRNEESVLGEEGFVIK